MSERGQFRGGRGSRGDRGGGRGGRGAGNAPGGDRKPKENILNLDKLMDKQITVFASSSLWQTCILMVATQVKFNGGREVQGTLKGYDQVCILIIIFFFFFFPARAPY